MIEIVYKEEEQETEKKKNVKLPKNVRQIGTIPQKEKIYVEDNVIRYLTEKPYSPTTWKYGVLLGEIKRGNGQVYIFVNGFVQTKYDENQEIHFDEMVWSDIYEQMHEYYPQSQVIGWFSYQYFKEEMDPLRLRKIHLDHFAGNDKIYLQIVEDTQEEYIYMYEDGEVKQKSGYYVYYDELSQTQEYIEEISYLSEENSQEQQQKSYGSFRAVMKELQDNHKPAKSFSLVQAASSFLVVLLLVAVIATMKNYGEMNYIKKTMEDIAGKLAGGNEQTEDDDEFVQVDVREVQGNVTKEVTDETKEEAVEKSKDNTTTKLEEGGEESGNEVTKEVAGEETEESTGEQAKEETENADDETTKKSTDNADSSEKTTKSTESETTGNKTDNHSETSAETTTKQVGTLQVDVSTEGVIENPDGTRTYEVREGESLGTISTKLYNTIEMVDEIMEANQIEDMDKIYVGQKLYLP